MATVEAVNPVARILNTRRSEQSDASAFGVFDHVLTSIQESSDKLETMAEESAEVRAQEQRREKELSQVLGERHEEQLESEPSRQEQLTDRTQDDSRADHLQEQATAPQRESRSEPSQEEVAESRPRYHDRPSQSPAASSPETSAAMSETVTASAPQQHETPLRRSGGSSSTTTMTGQPATMEQMKTAGAMPAGPASNNANPTNGAAANAAAGTGGNTNATTMNPARSGQGQGQMMRQSDAGTAQSAAKADVTAKPSGQTTEFQHLLQESARSRARIDQPTRTPQGETARPTGQTVNLDKAGSIKELAEIVRGRVSQQHSNMVLKLDPPELGKVRIDVDLRQGMLTVRMEAESQAGKDALESRLTDLKHTLEQQGVRVDRMEIEYRPPVTHPQPDDSNGQPYGQRDAQAQGSNDGRDDGSGRSGGSSNDGQDSALSYTGDALLQDPEQGQVNASAETGVDLVV